MNFERVPSGNPQRELVYEQLKRAIQEGTLTPGEKLVETTYAQIFGVSRTPVREAIRLLEGDGLVTYIPKKGTFVRDKLSYKDVEELYSIRGLLQVKSCDGLIECIQPEELAAMKEANENCHAALRSMDEEQFFSNLDCFHELQTNASRMPLLIRLLEQIEIYRPALQFMKTQGNNDRHLNESNYDHYKGTIEEHDAIIAALETKNKEELVRVVEYHAERFREIALANYSK